MNILKYMSKTYLSRYINTLVNYYSSQNFCKIMTREFAKRTITQEKLKGWVNGPKISRFKCANRNGNFQYDITSLVLKTQLIKSNKGNDFIELFITPSYKAVGFLLKFTEPLDQMITSF